MDEQNPTGGHRSGGKGWERDGGYGVVVVVVEEVFEELLDAHGQLRWSGNQQTGSSEV